MCTVVLSLDPGERVPLLLLGVRDELTGRPWRPPAGHWPPAPLVGGLDEQAGGTWLAVNPGARRVAALLNGRGREADQAGRRSRGELPLRLAGEGGAGEGGGGAGGGGAGGVDALKELADDHGALAAYDPFYLVVAEPASAALLSWDGVRAMTRDLAPGTHLLTNAGHAYPPDQAHPEDPADEPKAAYFAAKFAASRPSADPALPVGAAWGDWLTLAAGDALDRADPRAIIARRTLPDGRLWGSTSVTLVGLAADGLRYDFQPSPGSSADWHPVLAGRQA